MEAGGSLRESARKHKRLAMIHIINLESNKIIKASKQPLRDMNLIHRLRIAKCNTSKRLRDKQVKNTKS